MVRRREAWRFVVIKVHEPAPQLAMANPALDGVDAVALYDLSAVEPLRRIHGNGNVVAVVAFLGCVTVCRVARHGKVVAVVAFLGTVGCVTVCCVISRLE